MSNVKETILQYGSTKGQTGATERAKRVSVVTSIYSHSQSSNDISRLGVNVGSPLQTGAKQLENNRLRFNSGGDLSARTNIYTAVTNSITTTTSGAGSSGSARRLLPSPASNKVIQNLKKLTICFESFQRKRDNNVI